MGDVLLSRIRMLGMLRRKRLLRSVVTWKGKSRKNSCQGSSGLLLAKVTSSGHYFVPHGDAVDSTFTLNVVYNNENLVQRCIGDGFSWFVKVFAALHLARKPKPFPRFQNDVQRDQRGLLNALSSRTYWKIYAPCQNQVVTPPCCT